MKCFFACTSLLVCAERLDEARLSLELQALEAHESALHRSEVQMMPGMDGMGQVMKIMAICAVVGIAYKMVSGLCASRKCDCRRFKIIAQCLLAWGWDEFESFEILMSVHSVQDIQNEGLFGKKEFKVKASFNWSNTETSGTSDMRWEQTKKLEVPQGASEGVISLWSLGTIKDSKIAAYSLDTKKDMLDKADSFFGKKQKLKLTAKGKTVGTLLVTFRKRGKGEGDLGDCPIEGIDDDSPLLIDVHGALQEMLRKKELLPLRKGEKLPGGRGCHEIGGRASWVMPMLGMVTEGHGPPIFEVEKALRQQLMAQMEKAPLAAIPEERVAGRTGLIAAARLGYSLGDLSKTDLVLQKHRKLLNKHRKEVSQFLELNRFQRDVNCRKGLFTTYPLHEAVKQRDAKMLQMLLKFGASDTKDFWGRTAYDYACVEPSGELLRVFERMGCCPSSKGRTFFRWRLQ